MDIMSLLNQVNSSNNPLNMVTNMLPSNQKQLFNKIANTETDEQKAQILADLCNKNNISKEQLEQAFRSWKK